MAGDFYNGKEQKEDGKGNGKRERHGCENEGLGRLHNFWFSMSRVMFVDFLARYAYFF